MNKFKRKSLISLVIALIMILNLVPFSIVSYALSDGISANVIDTTINLGTVKPGYDNDDYVQNIEIENTGTNFFYHQYTRFDFTGKDADKFIAGYNGGGVFSVGQTSTTTYYIKPVSGLDTGIYTAEVAYQLSESNNGVYETLDTFTVTFTVLEHNYASEWTTTQYEHWHACQDLGCSGKGNLGSHDKNVTKDAVEPTFDTDGYTGDKYCSVCDYKVENGKPIAAGKYIRESRVTMTPAAFVSGNTPSDYTFTSTEPSKYTIEIGNWWDLTTSEQITSSTQLIKDHEYRVAISFTAVENYVYNETEEDYGSNFYVNGNEIGTTLGLSYTTYRTYDVVCLDGTLPIYTVTFNSNGGSAVPSQMVNEGHSPITPTNPTKDNLTFWNWRKGGTNIYDLSTLSITEDTTLVAIWVTTFNVLAGENGKVAGTTSAGEPSSYNTGSNGIIYEGTTEYFWAKADDAYEFKEWQNISDNSTYSTKNPIVIKSGENVGPRVRAIFIEASDKRYTVTFDSRGGSEVFNQKVDEGNTAVRPSDPTKEGFAFENWYTDTSFTQVFDFSTPITQTITLYAKWTPTTAQAYTVTFDSNGGSEVPSQIVYEGDSPVIPENPTKDKLTFYNWKKGGTNIWDLSTLSITEDTTLVAVWVTRFKVNPDGYGKIGSSNSAEVEPTNYYSGMSGIIYEGTTQYFWVKPNDGYEFKEWQNVSDGSKYSVNNPLAIKSGEDIGPDIRAICIEKHDHEPKAAVRENEIAATCSNEGSYDEVIYCSICDKELSRTKKTIEKLAHTPKEAVKENEAKATCSKEGSYDEVVYCSVCGAEISRTKKTIEKVAHTPKEETIETLTKATLSKDGKINKSIVSKCEVCGEEIGRREETIVIAYPKTISLSKKSFTYNGKVQKPTVKVVGSDGKTIDVSNYTITYSDKNSKKAGRYKVTITFKGEYYTGKKELTYDIVPKGTTLSKLVTGSKQFKATWKAQKTETSGYEVQYATNSKFTSGKKTVNVKSNKTTTSTVKKLKGNKKYYVRIRTYKTVKFGGKNIKVYSGWSKLKNVKTKK